MPKLWRKKCYLIVTDMLDGSVVAVGIERYVAWISTVGNNPAQPHEEVPVDETVMRTPQIVPRYWNTLLRQREQETTRSG